MNHEDIFREFYDSPLLNNISKLQAENVKLRAENKFLQSFILDHICRCYYLDDYLDKITIHGKYPNPSIHIMFSHVFNILEESESLEEARNYLEEDFKRSMEFIEMIKKEVLTL